MTTEVLPLASVRFPVAPLWRYVELRWAPTSSWRINFSIKEMALACDVTPRTVQRWRNAGLTWLAADEMATRLGTHPGEIWGYDAWFADTNPDLNNEEPARCPIQLQTT